MGSFKQSEIDYSDLHYQGEAHSVNPNTKKAVSKYNEETGIYKLWGTWRHTMVFNTVDIYNDIAKGNKMVYANIMLLIAHTGRANMIEIRKGGRYYAVNSEQALMELLDIKKSKWYELKPILFDEKMPILGISTHTLGKKTIIRYFLNPLLTAYYKGISINCYNLFREYLEDFLSESDLQTLEYWAREYENDSNTVKSAYRGFLPTEIKEYEKEQNSTSGENKA